MTFLLNHSQKNRTDKPGDFVKFFICPTNAHNSYKIVKLLKSFKIIIIAPTSSVYINYHQGALSLCFAKVIMLISVTYIVI